MISNSDRYINNVTCENEVDLAVSIYIYIYILVDKKHKINARTETLSLKGHHQLIYWPLDPNQKQNEKRRYFLCGFSSISQL